MKKISLYVSLLLSSMLLFQACGSSDSDTNKLEQNVSSDYVNLAKYHFSRLSRELKKDETLKSKNNKKFRSYPGATTQTESNNVMSISAITPFDKYIETMTIKNGSELIKVEVKNKLYVIISHYDGTTLLDKKELTLHKFKSFNMLDEEI